MELFSQFKNSKNYLAKKNKDSDLLVNMTPEMIREYQLFLFEMYKDLRAVCQKHGLLLYAVGGTALGAVRHKGFIPWDDDMDFLMTRADYEKLKKVFNREMGDKYLLSAPNCHCRAKHRIAMLMKKGTYYRKVVDAPFNNYIYMDLFILENIPDQPILRKLHGYHCNLLATISWEVFVWENRSPRIKEALMAGGAMGYYLRILIGFLFSFRPSYRWFNTYDHVVNYKKKNTRYCTVPTGRKKYFGEILLREKLFPGKEIPFENDSVWVFKDIDYYLKNLYGGDYMEIPPLEDRERHLTCKYSFDVRKDNRKQKEKNPD